MGKNWTGNPLGSRDQDIFNYQKNKIIKAHTLTAATHLVHISVAWCSMKGS